MDKYEFNIKVEQIKKMAAKGDYETAMKIADTIDWRRVRNANLLSSIAEIYEQNQEYDEAKDILLLAFERAPVGKRLLYKLSEISVEAGDIQDAEDFYREFCEMSPDDSRQYLLRYMILKAKGAPAEQLINSLEQYSATDVDERWLYELAVLYSKAAREDDCIRTCDKIMLLFGLGKYVDKAMELKLQYAPLTKQQMDLVENRDKYEEKLRKVEREYGTSAADYYDDTDEVLETPMASRDDAMTETSISRTQSQEGVGQDVQEQETSGDSEIRPAAVITEDDAVSYNDAAALVEEDVAEEPSYNPYHMIIEARTREEGLNIAIDELKYFHEQYGLNNKVAKTNAEKLNAKGFSIFIPKLAGKDLIVEDAGMLKLEVLDEIDAYMEQLTDLASIVLVDVIDHFDEMAEARPDFISRFDIVSDAEEEEEEDLFEDIDLNLTTAAVEAEQQMSEERVCVQESESMPAPQPEVVCAEQPMETSSYDADEYTEEADEAYEDEEVYDDAYEDEVYEEDDYDEDAYGVEDSSDETYDAETDEVYEDDYDSYDDAFYGEEDDTEYEDGTDDALPDDYYEEMDIDDFATYAQQYAKQIDCILPGKTVLALYERIELMEEDEIPLTKATAEELIEEAADRAEKPSISKRLTGMFNSKYDKDGHLILREEHFIH